MGEMSDREIRSPQPRCPQGFAAGTVVLASLYGEVTVPACLIAGLAVHHVVVSNGRCGPDHSWCLTRDWAVAHAATGLAFGYTRGSKRDAVKCAWALAACGVAWTRLKRGDDPGSVVGWTKAKAARARRALQACGASPRGAAQAVSKSAIRNIRKQAGKRK